MSIDLAELGGERVVAVKQEHKLHAESKGETKEGKQEMKTDGDMQSHRTILAGFHTAFPWLDSRVSIESNCSFASYNYSQQLKYIYFSFIST